MMHVSMLILLIVRAILAGSSAHGFSAAMAAQLFARAITAAAGRGPGQILAEAAFAQTGRYETRAAAEGLDPATLAAAPRPVMDYT